MPVVHRSCLGTAPAFGDTGNYEKAAGIAAPYGKCSSKRRRPPLGEPWKGGPGAASAHVLILAFRLAPILVLRVLPGTRPAVSSCLGSALTCTSCKVEAQRVQPRVRRRTGRGFRALGGRREGRGGAGPGPWRVGASSPRLPREGVTKRVSAGRGEERREPGWPPVPQASGRALSAAFLCLKKVLCEGERITSGGLVSQLLAHSQEHPKMNKSQRSVSSKDLTVDFTPQEEWQQLCPTRRLLDRAVILENCRQLVSVGEYSFPG
uniref:Uncharacterized protein LOC112827036 n=1 Tax=Callorhinus ursinus TaxID=34884 RepID=A0A3Q7PBF4_CALUR|nr:uncharacterized protein LOC112827036 [Callorhinus ursinus]